MDIRHAAYAKTSIVLAYCPKEGKIPRRSFNFKLDHFYTNNFIRSQSLRSFQRNSKRWNGTKARFLGNNMSRFDPQVGKWPPYGVAGWPLNDRNVTLFYKANIFRGLSQLSRKTQFCALLGRDTVWFSGSCVFCENV